jgi:hypothetical protein
VNLINSLNMKITHAPILVVLVLLFSCSPKEKITEISYSPLKQNSIMDAKSENIVIRNKEDLLKLKDSKTLDVDLNKKTVLGFRGQIGGCSDPDFDIKVIRDDSKKLYTVEANVQQNGMCKKLIFYQKFIAIDKIKKNYQVVFKTKNIPNDRELHKKGSK